jgi:hypothetical protein
MTGETLPISGLGAAAKGRAAWLERAAMASAAAFGAGCAALFAEPVLAWIAGAWTRYLLPAYDEMIRNGLLSWCF